MERGAVKFFAYTLLAMSPAADCSTARCGLNLIASDSVAVSRSPRFTCDLALTAKKLHAVIRGCAGLRLSAGDRGPRRVLGAPRWGPRKAMECNHMFKPIVDAMQRFDFVVPPARVEGGQSVNAEVSQTVAPFLDTSGVKSGLLVLRWRPNRHQRRILRLYRIPHRSGRNDMADERWFSTAGRSNSRRRDHVQRHRRTYLPVFDGAEIPGVRDSGAGRLHRVHCSEYGHG